MPQQLIDTLILSMGRRCDTCLAISCYFAFIHSCLVEKWLLGAVARVAIHAVAGCHGHSAGLPWCHGSILGVTVYCKQWHPIPFHQLWKWCVAVKQRQVQSFPTRSLHTNTVVITAEIESGFARASLKTSWLNSAAVQFPPAPHHSKRRS
ncbi:hypothetical protein TNCV_4464821 [Trichonephila clavipes]|nr:hypothetical protein TNCV_4464821 [Trichonephila clavipes]